MSSKSSKKYINKISSIFVVIKFFSILLEESKRVRNQKTHKKKTKTKN